MLQQFYPLFRRQAKTWAFICYVFLCKLCFSNLANVSIPMRTFQCEVLQVQCQCQLQCQCQCHLGPSPQPVQKRYVWAAPTRVPSPTRPLPPLLLLHCARAGRALIKSASFSVYYSTLDMWASCIQRPNDQKSLECLTFEPLSGLIGSPEVRRWRFLRPTFIGRAFLIPAPHIYETCLLSENTCYS